MDDFPFAITSEAAVLAEYKAAGVVIFKNFDEGRNDMEGEVTEESVMAFVAGNSLPLVVDFSQDTARRSSLETSSPTCCSSCLAPRRTTLPR